MKPIVLIKTGGEIVLPGEKRKILLTNLISISQKYHVIFVHGGKYQINQDVKNKPKFIQGQRYTDKETLIQVTSVLGRINKEIVNEFNSIAISKKANIRGVGISGIDGKIIEAETIESLGYVGKIKSVNPKLINLLLSNNYIPFIYPICGVEYTLLNVNADNVASALATSLKVDKLIFISNVPGILDKNNNIISVIDIKTIKNLLKEKVINEGMIPKVESCLTSIREGVKEIYITNNVNLYKKNKFIFLGTFIKK
jgi:acetylglutamate kinase